MVKCNDCPCTYESCSCKIEGATCAYERLHEYIDKKEKETTN